MYFLSFFLFKDLVRAYKGLLKEKEALQNTVSALTTAPSQPKQATFDITDNEKNSLQSTEVKDDDIASTTTLSAASSTVDVTNVNTVLFVYRNVVIIYLISHIKKSYIIYNNILIIILRPVFFSCENTVSLLFPPFLQK